MSKLTLTESATPGTPAATKKSLYLDSADGRLKYIDANGLVRTLTSVEWPKNHLINGGFNFAQRQVATTLTAPAAPGAGPRTYTADRWFACIETAGLQYQTVDTITTGTEGALSHRYYGRWKKITNAGKLAVGQIMTAENSAVLRGKRVRLNLKLKRTVAAAMTVRIGVAYLAAAGTHDVVPGYVAGAPSGNFLTAFGGAGVDPTLGANLTQVAPVANSADGGAIVGNAVQVALTGVFARVSGLFDIPSTAKNVVVLVWTDAQLAINDELNIGEALFTEGVEIADWMSIPQIQELERCQRFYTKSFPIGSAPAQNFTIAAGGHIKGWAAQAAAVAFAHMGILFAVRMRAAPTIVLFNPAAANAFLRQLVTPSDATATSATSITDSGFDVTATGLAAWVKGDGVAIHYTADAEL